MGASVRIEDGAFSDPRVELLGALLGTSKFDALGRLAYLWRYATDRQAHSLPVAIVALYCDPDALVNSELGERVEDGNIRLRGTAGRIEWIAKLRKNAKKGGKAKAAKRQPKGTPDGTPDGLPYGHPELCPPSPSPSPSLNKSPPTPPRGEAFDWGKIYELYPRKAGKKTGLARLPRLISSQAEYDQLLRAVQTMAAAWRQVPDQISYCPHFSSFVNGERWRDAELPLPGRPSGRAPDPQPARLKLL